MLEICTVQVLSSFVGNLYDTCHCNEHIKTHNKRALVFINALIEKVYTGLYVSLFMSIISRGRHLKTIDTKIWPIKVIFSIPHVYNKTKENDSVTIQENVSYQLLLNQLTCGNTLYTDLTLLTRVSNCLLSNAMCVAIVLVTMVSDITM